MPKVSVIIPAYNSDKYIGETLDSVLNQTYADFEVIVVDDGSKDKTVSVVKQYQTKYREKLKLIQKENGGPASARNVGIKAAKGEYIAFNDADDLWLPEKLEKQVEFFNSQKPEAGLIYTNAKKFDQDGIWKLPEKYRNKFFSGWIYKDLLNNNFIPNQSVMVRKRCFANVGLFDESRDIITSEDYDMWLRIAQKFKILYLDEVLSLYREHAQGINKNIARAANAALAVLEKHLILAAGNLAMETSVKKALVQSLDRKAYSFITIGLMTEARKLLIRSLKLKPSIKPSVLMMVSFLPYSFLCFLNKIIKAVYRPQKIIKKNVVEFY